MVLVTLRVSREENGEMVTFRVFSLQHLVFSETFQSEIYPMFKQIFLLNAQFTIVCFDLTLWKLLGCKICRGHTHIGNF